MQVNYARELAMGVVPSLKQGRQLKSQKISKKFRIIDMVKQSGFLVTFRRAEFKSWQYLGLLTLLLQGFWPFFCPNSQRFTPVFSKTRSFSVKLGSQIFQNLCPCKSVINPEISSTQKLILQIKNMAFYNSYMYVIIISEKWAFEMAN